MNSGWPGIRRLSPAVTSHGPPAAGLTASEAPTIVVEATVHHDSGWQLSLSHWQPEPASLALSLSVGLGQLESRSRLPARDSEPPPESQPAAAAAVPGSGRARGPSRSSGLCLLVTVTRDHRRVLYPA